MTRRLTCLCPGCHRTRGQRKGEPPIHDGEEWICGVHWRAVPKHLRKRLAKARRRIKRGDERWRRVLRRTWRRCRQIAIEEALMGLEA